MSDMTQNDDQDVRVSCTFSLSNKLVCGLRKRCKATRMMQSAVIEACIESFLDGRITIENGQAVSQPKVA